MVTRLTLRTHDLPAFFGGAWGTIQAQSDEAFRRLIERFVAFYAENLFNPHWGETVSFAPDNALTISMVCQGLDKDQAEAAWRPFFDWAKASPLDFSLKSPPGTGVLPARRFWDNGFLPFFVPDPRPGAPKFHGWWRGDQDQVGEFFHGYELVWLPASLLQEPERGRLADALFAASRPKKMALHFNKGLAGGPDEAIAAANDTATNPAATKAFALAIIADGEGAALSRARPTADRRDRGAKRRARDRSRRRRVASSRSGRRILCVRKQLLQSAVADGVLG